MVQNGGHVLKVVLMMWFKGLSLIRCCTEVTLVLLEAVHKQSIEK